MSTALSGTTLPALAAPPAPLPDSFLGDQTPLSFGPAYAMSANGETIIFNLSDGSVLVWTPNGLLPLADAKFVSGVSADGKTFVGVRTGTSFNAFWSDGHVQNLDDADSTSGPGIVTALSANGNVAVGYVPYAGGHRPAIWNGDGSLIMLADIANGTNYGRATAVSADGNVAIGYQWNSNTSPAFRWERGVGDDPDIKTDLGIASASLLLSGDGQVIVSKGSAWRRLGGAVATIETTPYLPGATSTGVSALSYDGKIIIGYSNSTLIPSQYRAFRWVDGVGTDLGTLAGGGTSVANAMSDDGLIVVGSAYDDTLQKNAVRWGEDDKIDTIAALLAKGGVDIGGWSLTEAEAISADGNIIVGRGSFASTSGYWIAHCAIACNSLVSPEVLAESYAGLGALGATASTYLGTELATAGDMAAAAPGGITGFAYGAFDSDPTNSATVGASYDLGSDLTLVGALGIAGIETVLPYDGVAHFSGPAATIALASTPDTGFNWLVGGSLIGLSGTVERGYLNGNTPVTSSGSTSGHGAGLTAELGFTFNDLIADTLVTPFVNVTVSSVSFAGYSETGGPFPATFEPFTTNSALLRLGTEFSHEFQPGSFVKAGISYAHNFGNGGTISGVAGGIGVSVPGAAPISDFVEASIGLDLPVTEAISFSGRLAGILPLNGAPPSVQARAGLTMAF